MLSEALEHLPSTDAAWSRVMLSEAPSPEPLVPLCHVQAKLAALTNLEELCVHNNCGVVV